jgi:hypothetical protein
MKGWASIRAVAAGLIVAAASMAGDAAETEADKVAKIAPSSGQTHVAQQLYLSGLARMARGDAAGALGPFQVLAESVPELGATHYALATALLLSDFDRRGRRALPVAEAALAREPGNPLYAVVRTLSDPARGTMRADGALYLTEEAGAEMKNAAAALPATRSATNGRFLATVFGNLEPTGDAQYPWRLPGFSRMIAPGFSAEVPGLPPGNGLGRLLAASLPENGFASYEGRLVGRLQDGLASLSPEQIEAARVRTRQRELRDQSSSLRPF